MSVRTTQIINAKGEFIAAGITSLVERVPNGNIIKRPRGDGSLQDLTTEANVYQMLGAHPRLIAFRSWDPASYTLELDFMPNGTLQEYMKQHLVPLQRRRQWMEQAVEGVAILHASNIIHCDIGPHNFLLDKDLDLKIADFGGSSVCGSRATVCPSIRFRAPDPDWHAGKLPTITEDLFSLGSVLYFLYTGRMPFSDLEEHQVEQNYQEGIFPDLTGLPCADVVASCWQKRARSAKLVKEALRTLDPVVSEVETRAM